MNSGKLSRRGFATGTIAAMGAAGLPGWFASTALAAADERSPVRKDGDPLRMACIGIGSPQSRCLAIYGEARNQKNHKTQFVAACDVDNAHLSRAVSIMLNHGARDVSAYRDFRDLNDRKDIDAVMVATPDHWHAQIAIDAMKKGKDVYCEKPLTLTIEEALAMVQVARKTGRVLATGSQQRSDPRFRLACELIRNGRVGILESVECRIGSNPVSGPIPKKPVPEGFDYDMWLGPCPPADYVNDGKHTRCHYEFRWWYEYSGGKMTDWGAHHLDIAQWAMGKDGSGPVAIEVLSFEKPSDDPNAYNTHPKFHVQYTYDDGTRVIAMHGDGSGPHKLFDKDGKESEIGPSENGVLFLGAEGKLFVSRRTILANDPKLISEPLARSAVRLSVSPGHMTDFLDCVKNRKMPICSVEIGASSVIVCHLGVIALRSGKKLKWDPVRNQFDDPEANAMIGRPRREPWGLVV
ncbi:MAG: Gfo/Idh/MocA family oxidoreductase [Gemmataceae bacterium]|nr:Gfo/Idh/MocA family oxidoreductase [Gemmataceae bacterium]